MEEQKNTEAVVNQRPSFLTALLIFTFAGAGLGILLGLIGLLGLNFLGNFAGNMAQMAEVDADLSALGGVNVKVIIGILMLAGMLVGAIMMWGLKKMGFWLYTIAKIVILVMAFGSGVWFFVKLIIGLGFIVGYAANLKHMS